MINIKEKTHISKLRFHEFSGDWEEKKLGDIVQIKSGKSKNKTLNGKYSFYGSKGIIGKSNMYDYNGKVIMIARVGAYAGYMYYVDGKYCVSDNTLIMSVTNPKSIHFVYFYLLNYHLNRIVFGSGQPLITSKLLQNIKILLPTLPEQQKIADFLSSVDKRIEQLTEKKEQLEQYKKGLMQKLFSQELRFKDDEGADYCDWEEKKLGEVAISYRLGGNYKNTLIPNKYPLIKMGNLKRGYFDIDKIEYIKPNEIIDQNDRINSGDLFFNTRNTLDLVGKVGIWRDELLFAYYNSNLMRIVFDNNYFMNYLLNSFNCIKKLRRYATGTTSVAAIYNRDLLLLEISLPSLPEQQKIADFLSGIDERIEIVDMQIEKTQEFKKGLLQRMFV